LKIGDPRAEVGLRDKAMVRDFALQNIILSIMCIYIAEIYATYFLQNLM